ncbi:MAG: hypothetical protein ACNI26_04470 [Terasakiella sp.]|uniref:hypothetical protein n=1 Tax=unclassified Terasakiella TaxID=2614952 RepID=UPI003AFFFB41
MSDTTQTNAMAEIALALAMGFFSIMVLTMVSMGGGMVSQSVKSVLDDDPIELANTVEKTEQDQAKGASRNVQPENLLIYYKDRFLDHTFKPVDPAGLAGRDKIVLAVDPDLSMSATMQVRKRVSAQDITVVVLNEKWLKALQEAKL